MTHFCFLYCKSCYSQGSTSAESWISTQWTFPNGWRLKWPNHSEILELCNQNTVKKEVSVKLQYGWPVVHKRTAYTASLHVIEQLPSEMELMLGSELQLALQVSGPGSEHLIYKWYKNGEHLATTREPVWQIKQVVLEDQGIYICSAHNETDSVLSTECLVTGKWFSTFIPNIVVLFP